MCSLLVSWPRPRSAYSMPIGGRHTCSAHAPSAHIRSPAMQNAHQVIEI
ncbi:hypothetical protein XOC_0155 [Xanthomonas oryzae pv. oryzicola BLS256]|uniref:Uncharacterized protein n=1 Tax=Xanthomonas oryzae pv. oryzicola (strain BLS256) TaxID=383407 RepID=G7TIW6_XANOB|nr:hypothetical protein XOC_0155 [Xanthomonas oryzae pv. oryzicola BLS256]QEO99827.1 hypothetical protein XOCgx_4840 [Xanthomonas oryzae pv. oryzicola]